MLKQRRRKKNFRTCRKNLICSKIFQMMIKVLWKTRQKQEVQRKQSREKKMMQSRNLPMQREEDSVCRMQCQVESEKDLIRMEVTLFQKIFRQQLTSGSRQNSL